MPRGRLDNALDALIINDHIISFGKFEEMFNSIQDGDVNSSLGTAKDLFFEFDPNKRPILWRILVTQALLYRCILELSRRRNMTSKQILDFVTCVPKEEKLLFDWRLSGQDVTDKMVYEPFDVAGVYLFERLKQPLQLLETISQRKVNAQAGVDI